MENLTCQVSSETYDRIKAVSDETGEPVGKVLDFIVEEYFKSQETE